MRYMFIHKLDDTNPAMWDPTPEFFARMGEFMREINKAGVLLAAEGLRPTSAGAARISVKEGQQTVVDGPFAEAKEVIAGFAIVQVRDQDEALHWAGKFAAMFDEVEVEVRRVTEFTDFG